MVPYADGDGVCLSDVAGRETQLFTRFSTLFYHKTQHQMSVILRKSDLRSGSGYECGAAADSQVVVLVPFGVQCALDCVCRVALT